MKIKVCGINDLTSLTKLIKLDIDFLGFIFYEPSSRNCTLDADVLIENIYTSSIQRVGVFVNASKEFIIDKTSTFKLDFVQLHGSEPAEYCKSLQGFDFKTIKAFSIYNGFDFNLIKQYEGLVDYLLFDTKGLNPGGNGELFNWRLLDNYNFKTPFFLSGGISIESLEEINAFKHGALYCLDINSKFEIKPGLKDVAQVESFVCSIKNENI